MRKNILIALFSLLLAACATTSTSIPPTADSAAHAIEHARHAQREAAEVGHEWRDTQQMIADAIQAAEAREFAKATDLAFQAERQSLAALRQYKSQKGISSDY